MNRSRRFLGLGVGLAIGLAAACSGPLPATIADGPPARGGTVVIGGLATS